MTDISLRYGKGNISAKIPLVRDIREVRPKFWPEIANLRQEIIKGLRAPIACRPLSYLARDAGSVTIVIGDQTRPLSSNLILPVVIDELLQAGLHREAIRILIGVGNHRGSTNEEKTMLLGPVYGKIQCLHSKETEYALLGMTKRGTPVEVALPVAQANLVIALGNIEFHQLTGFSGGVKAVAAGAASHRALEHNHRLSTLGEGGLGVMDSNTVRQDMEEFAQMANLSFIINVVLNEFGRVIAVVAGDPVKAHRMGCEKAQQVYAVDLEEPADIVIASPGGEPKDATVYQAQKTVRNALRAVKNRGIVIVAAKCREGFGDEVFEQWMSQADSPGELLARGNREFALGGHKGAFIAQAVSQARIFWVSDLSLAQVKALFFEPFNSLQEAVDKACNTIGEQAEILVMPWGGLTVPYVLETAGR